MAKRTPLDPSEEDMWRALMHLVVALPRYMDTDLIRGAGMSLSEYVTLMCLSEAPNRELRMSELAAEVALSASRTTRLVDDLQSRGFVTKQPSSVDGRGNVAKLTPRGMTKLKSAYPHHLESARGRVFDHVDPALVECTATALRAVVTNCAPLR